MGPCLSSQDGSDGSNQSTVLPLFFHPYVKGSQIILDESHCIAHRAATFHDGIVFSSRPVELYEKVVLKILKEDSKWEGGLRIGFTWQDPSFMEPMELPPFACPNLVSQGKTQACVLPDEYSAESNVVKFWVDGQGCVFCSINEEAEASFLLDGVTITSPVWAMVDVYGRTRTIQLLDPSSLSTASDVHSFLDLSLEDKEMEPTCWRFHPLPEGQTGDACAICFGDKANTVMLPCAHANFCSRCASKILKTSGQCPLCRQKVKKILPFCLLAEGESPEG